MVAHQPLELMVMVRIHAGQPSYYATAVRLDEASQEIGSGVEVPTKLHYSLSLAAK